MHSRPQGSLPSCHGRHDTGEGALIIVIYRDYIKIYRDEPLILYKDCCEVSTICDQARFLTSTVSLHIPVILPILPILHPSRPSIISCYWLGDTPLSSTNFVVFYNVVYIGGQARPASLGQTLTTNNIHCTVHLRAATLKGEGKRG